MKQNKQTVKLNESQLRKIIRTAINEASKAELDREWDKETIKDTYNNAKQHEYTTAEGDDLFRTDWEPFYTDDEPYGMIGFKGDNNEYHTVGAEDTMMDNDGNFDLVNDDDLEIDKNKLDTIDNKTLANHAKNLKNSFKQQTTDLMYDKFGNKNVNEHKSKVKINEHQLRNIIKENINRVLNESMIMPNSVKQIFWDGDDYFVVVGNNGRYYEAYPDYGDAYLVSDACSEWMESVAKKIEQSAINNNVYVQSHVYDWDEVPILIVQYNFDTYEKYSDKIKVWLEKKGFKLKESDEMYMEDQWIYPNYKPGYKEGKLEELTNGMKDVTDQVAGFFYYGYRPKDTMRSVKQYLLSDDKADLKLNTILSNAYKKNY